MDIELSGFAEFPDEIDGDFNAFNYCLAEEYVGALYNEEFNITGQMDCTLFDNICYWYNYDEHLGNKEEANKLRNATFTTINNRSIVDAIYDKNYASLAFVYVGNGIYLPKLILTILFSDDLYYDIHISENDNDKINNIFKDLFDFVEKEYQKNNDIEFLKKFKNNFDRIYVLKQNRPIIETDNYTFIKTLKRSCK